MVITAAILGSLAVLCGLAGVLLPSPAKKLVALPVPKDADPYRIVANLAVATAAHDSRIFMAGGVFGLAGIVFAILAAAPS